MKHIIVWYFLAKIWAGSPGGGLVIAAGPYPTKQSCIVAKDETFRLPEGGQGLNATYYFPVDKMPDCFAVRSKK